MRALAAARQTGGVLGRRELLRLGMNRWEIEAECRAGRWQRFGRQTIKVCDGDAALARWYRALHEVGWPAVLDGVSALVAAGLRGIEEPVVHVAVPKSANPRRCRGVAVHETRRYDRTAVLPDGVPRMRPATAAVHAALWARSDRQAALYVVAAGQQGLFTPEQLALEVESVRRDRRRGLLRGLCRDVAGGIEALGERDFARLIAARGLPEPDRQVRRRTPSGHYRYDNVWDAFGLTVEIDGVHHLDATAWIGDALKQNEVSLDGHVVLRIPNFALRADPDPFLDQVEQALRRGGWRP
jgi:very-short-patch-repair endonuclease